MTDVTPAEDELPLIISVVGGVDLPIAPSEHVKGRVFGRVFGITA
ncbi:MAG: hypothetical protein JWN29_3894 [Acidimicrobiales bacterium]|nr:hypothetical protein [Acidimicrobiales bacterium]